MKSTWIKDVFGTNKAIIGLVHMQPLPGDPKYDAEGGMEKVIELARKDVEALQNGGVDGMLFTNEFSVPYQGKVGAETVAAMAYVMGALKAEIHLPYGNDALDDPLASIALASATGARFTRGVFHGTWATTTGMCNSDGCAEAARLRHNLGMDDFKLVSYLMPESSGDLAGRDPFTVLKPQYFLYRPDGLAVTGIVAGQKPDVGTVRQCRETFPEAVIFASTGVNINNVQDYMEYMDAAFVGTSFKKEGNFWNGIDEDRVRKFMDRVKELRKVYD